MHQETDTDIRHKNGAKNELFQFCGTSYIEMEFIDIKYICNYILWELLKLKILWGDVSFTINHKVLHCKYERCNLSTTFNAWLVEEC